MRCNRLDERTEGIMVRINSLAIAILFFCTLTSSVWGQNAGTLSGTVEDGTGEYVVGADVRLRNQVSGQELSASSTEEGLFRFDHVAFGDYLLIVNVQGFKSAELPVKVGEHKTIPIHVALQIASSADSVTVSANSESIPALEQNSNAVELDRHWL